MCIVRFYEFRSTEREALFPSILVGSGKEGSLSFALSRLTPTIHAHLHYPTFFAEISNACLFSFH